MRNLKLNYESFEPYLLERNELRTWKGVQYVFKFENCYGASVIKHDHSSGNELDRWELAVITFDRYNDWDLDTTCDVYPCLTDERVRELLGEIKGLT